MKEIVNTKLTKIALIGLGYVGLPLAMEFCKKIAIFVEFEKMIDVYDFL